ncbi:DUF6153 family protein [Streptomyces sp. NBC_01351]|uniref:DUF6153 family protein n=1 Tax=Streptomyces sp. NBC_01351 TaxID=2903833 RepID=UPI002E35D8F6|nr:DUF6153 family protein [Streptomyces sp. NBC_01351]
MISRVQPSSRRPAGRGFVLLVLAVLAGVLAMHGLGPGPSLARTPAAVGGHVMAAGHHEPAGTVVGAPEGCSHTDGGSGHTHHADATCAATGIGTAYAPPAPAAALEGAPAAEAPHAVATASAQSGRGPPDLAELQLLRI